MHLPLELDKLALVGLTVVFAFLVGKVFQRVGIPQVVGYIVGGALLGPSALNLVPGELNSSLTFVTEIALGLIGFEMGGHLVFGKLRQMGRSILLIVLLEALGAFVLVSAGVFLITKALHIALIFGALAAATDPASTVDVLTEYHADGPLTTHLLAVVGLDDAVSLLLFSVSAAAAETMLGGAEALTAWQVLKLPLVEIGGSLALGIILGLALHASIRYLRLDPHQHDAMVVPIGAIFLGAGLTRVLGLSLTLTTMIMGIVVVNRDAYNGHYIRATIERAGPVIYILFFALAGARLRVEMLPAMGLIGVVYLLLRNGGKLFGAWAGGVLGGAGRRVSANLGFALFAQAGVVIGLALDSSLRFTALGPEGAEVGARVLAVITATTLVAQLIGPIFVKMAVFRAGENGRALERLVE